MKTILSSKETVHLNNFVNKKNPIIKKFIRDRWLYVMVLPGVLYFIIFKFFPMWGVLIAFKEYSPFSGFFASKWVGFANFENFFSNPDFIRLLRNTLILSGYNLIFFFPAPIILALLLNEIRFSSFKRIVQALVYIPHFISIVVVASITYIFFTVPGGILYEPLNKLTGLNIDILGSVTWFRTMIIGQIMWKETGWGIILFLAALAGVNVELYEAAVVDGAGRIRQLWHITLPAIRSTIVIILILRLGVVLDNGFEQIFLMTNSLNREVADVFDTYVYFMGITQGAFSYSTAVGLFKSLIGIFLIQTSNFLAKKAGETGVF